MAKTKSISTGKIALEDMPDALTEILTDFQRSSFDVRQNAVQAGAEVFKSAVEQATPRDTGGMADSWEIKTKYKDRRYVGNTKTVNGGDKENIPLSNVLEYAEKSPHAGFIRRCFDSTEPQVFDAIKKTIQNGGSNNGK